MFTQLYKDIDELHKLITPEIFFMAQLEQSDDFLRTLWKFVKEATNDIHPSM